MIGELVDIKFPFKAIIGSLQVATFTQPDISYVSLVVKYVSSPKKIGCNVVKSLKYLHCHAELRLCFSTTSTPNLLTAYTDAVYAMDLDDRKSQTRFVIFLNNAPVACGSKKQPSCSSSTAEVEYIW